MLIRALKTTTGHPKGSVYEVDAATGKELIALGYAIEEMPIAKQEAAPVAANDNIPFEIAPTGFQTGAEVPQLSLQADQALKTPTLMRPEADSVTAGKYASSPSTTDTNSAHGQTHSTPATTTGGKRKRGRPRSRD
jgi:hypothetical protein